MCLKYNKGPVRLNALSTDCFCFLPSSTPLQSPLALVAQNQPFSSGFPLTKTTALAWCCLSIPCTLWQRQVEDSILLFGMRMSYHLSLSLVFWIRRGSKRPKARYTTTYAPRKAASKDGLFQRKLIILHLTEYNEKA